MIGTHGMLAYTEADIASAGMILLEILGSGEPGIIGGRQIRGPTQTSGSCGITARQGLARGLTRGHGSCRLEDRE